MRAAVAVLGTIALVAIGIYAYTAAIGNPRLVREVLADPGSELAKRILVLDLPSGRRQPVRYLREGDTVFAACDGRWWRELRGDGAPVTVHIRGETLRGQARAVRDDPDERERIFRRLRPRTYWWVGTKLIEIRLEAGP